MSEAARLSGWREGADAIAYQSCGRCRHVWYFRRAFCPACGTEAPYDHRSGGRGVVFAVTIVRRAATPEAKAHVPYAIMLVDMAEGFRIMAHGDPGLRIGDAVRMQFRPFAGVRVPHVVKA